MFLWEADIINKLILFGIYREKHPENIFCVKQKGFFPQLFSITCVSFFAIRFFGAPIQGKIDLLFPERKLISMEMER